MARPKNRAYLPRPKPVAIRDIIGQRKNLVYVDRATGEVKEVVGAFTGYRDEFGRALFQVAGRGPELAIYPGDVRHIGKLRRVWRLTCQRCGYRWESRVERPKACTGCSSRVWDKPPTGDRPPWVLRERNLLEQWRLVASDILAATAHAHDADKPSSLRYKLAMIYRETNTYLDEREARVEWLRSTCTWGDDEGKKKR